jgi:radical SAM superfamily enzyme YgiQ (UPF0313 family)
MNKVLLVNSNTEKSPYPVPPLGICLIASVIQKEYEVAIYDGAFDDGKGLPGTVLDFKPDYIGITIRNIDDMDIINPTNYIEQILNKFIKPIRELTHAPIILGGSAFSIFPEYLMKYYHADFGVFGEGERVFPELLRCLDGGGNPSSVPGVLVEHQAGFSMPHSFNLGNLPFSDIDLKIDYTPYRSRGSYPVQTKRGCVHRCIYCTYNCIEGYSYRTRTPASVVDEIERASSRLGNTTFEFVDSTFNDPPEHAEAVCREIIRRKLNLRLRTMGINPCNVDRELFDLMLAAGFAQVDCTPDTASSKMLINLRKNFTLDDLKKTAAIVRHVDIPTMWFFVFGGPGETEETIKESFEFIDTWVSRKDMVHITFGLRIYPGTDLYRLALEDKLLKLEDSMLETRFYISREIGKERLFEIINRASQTRPNCVPVTETNPSPDMMREAIAMREEMRLNEPMFRSLLRIRYRMFGQEMPGDR